MFKKETFLVCLERTLPRPATSIRDVRSTALILRGQYWSYQLLFDVRHVAEELTIDKHYLTHAVRIDRVILRRQDVPHVVLNGLGVRRCAIAVQTTDSSVAVL